MGMISDKNTRIALTLPKQLKAELEAEARKENRSTTNMIVTILQKYMRKGKKENV